VTKTPLLMGFLVYELNCQYNNEGADEMILPLFPAFLDYCKLLWQHFPPVFLKLQLSIEIEYTKSFMYPHKKEILYTRTRGALPTLHHTPTQYLSIHYSKINSPFSQNFRLNHRINT
jgi:hypothetical protein